MEQWQKNIAQEMALQLGGNKLMAATGAKLSSCINSLQQIEITAVLPARNTKQGINAVKVAYNDGMDTYIMTFLNTRLKLNSDNQIIKKYDEVYCDQLIDLFESETGLVVIL